jgi:hypothetical protein
LEAARTTHLISAYNRKAKKVHSTEGGWFGFGWIGGGWFDGFNWIGTCSSNKTPPSPSPLREIPQNGPLVSCKSLRYFFFFFF